MKLSNKKKWLKVIEFAVVGAATWLNPNAAFLLFLLQLCFQILEALQKDEQSETNKGQRISPHLPVVSNPINEKASRSDHAQTLYENDK